MHANKWFDIDVTYSWEYTSVTCIDLELRRGHIARIVDVRVLVEGKRERQ
jgi:hypothetical protein